MKKELLLIERNTLCANYEGSKKVREAKALMLVHQYELFKMKDDESIEQMYSRFQTLVWTSNTEENIFSF